MNSNIIIVVILIVSTINFIYKINKKPTYNISNQVVGRIVSIKQKEDKTQYILKNKYNYIVNYSGNHKFNLGDMVKVKGKTNTINNNTIFNLFNHKKYYLSKNTISIIKSDAIEKISCNKNVFYKLKVYILNRISKIKKSEYLKTFILGDNSDIEDNVLSSYRQNGINHLFAISGMHTTLLSHILFFILNKIRKSKYNYIIVISLLYLFCFLTSFTPSVIRAASLFTLIVINKFLNLNLSNIRILIIIFAINFNINPYNIYNVGFIFSYVITFSLMFYSEIINNQKNYMFKTIFTSLIAFIVSIPILINNYFSINLMTIFNNIIFVPIITFLVFPMSIVVVIIPKLEILYIAIINILEVLSLFVNKFKIEIVLCKVNLLIVFIYYLIIFIVLNNFKKKKYKCIVYLIILIIIHTNIGFFTKNNYVTFLDVGQGDSTFLHYGYNKGDVLIDTGGKFNYSVYKNIIDFLKSKGIKKISYLILTHGDYDHMGEAINLVKNFKVEKVIFNCGEFNDLEKKLIKVLDKKKIKYYSCIKELNIDNSKLYFLQTDIYDNENDNSNVIYTELNGYKFMFMGDASTTTEKEILNKYNLPDIDVLKVGHHGSRTSSSKEFINEINPKYSIISVGKNNRYGHPNKEVLNNLEKSRIYRTDIDGSIMFKIKNNKMQIETCAP